MDNQMESPLATSAKRNRLARAPLRKDLLSKSVKPDDTHKGQGNSPPNSQYTTSSPRDSAAAADPKDDDTPGVSMIDKEMLGTSRSVSRRSSGRRSNTLKFDDDDKANESDDSDSQPSAKVSYRSKQDRSTAMTPARIKKRHDRSQNLPDETGGGGLSMFTLGMGFGIAFICFTIGVAKLDDVYSNQGFITDFNVNKSLTILKEGLDELAKDFPSQNKHSWSIIRASLKSIAKPNPLQPSVILLVSQSEMEEKISNCLAKRLDFLVANALEKEFKSGRHSGEEFKSKNDLFDSLNSELERASRYLLFNLQNLPGESAMALHGFTDNLNAPFKRAVIIFTLTSDIVERNGVENMVEQKLLKSWSGSLDEDRISPLLSRIAVSTIKVVPEATNPKCDTYQ